MTNSLLYDFSRTATPSGNIDPQDLDRPLRWETKNDVRFKLFKGPIGIVICLVGVNLP